MIKKGLSLLIVLTLIMGLVCQPALAYNGKDAAAYAQKYAKEYNGSYKSFNADCTNFVSQCAKAGGIKMKAPDSLTYNNKVYNTKTYWFMKKNKEGKWRWSSTWSLVSTKSGSDKYGFYNYMKEKKGAPVSTYEVGTTAKLNKFIKACSVGDVIQVRQPNQATKHHSVIVTSKSYDEKNKRYNMKVCYHTTDTKNADFRNTSWKKFGTDVEWTLIKLTSL